MGRIWVIDGNNVMGSRPDGWWNDPTAGMERLTQQVAEWCWTHDDDVVLVFDGRERPSVVGLSGGNLTVSFSGRAARDSADDVIAASVADGDAGTTVVTADRGLLARLPPPVRTEGPRTFLDRLG